LIIGQLISLLWLLTSCGHDVWIVKGCCREKIQ